jgi:multiple sugar transport system permease protein
VTSAAAQEAFVPYGRKIDLPRVGVAAVARNLLLAIAGLAFIVPLVWVLAASVDAGATRQIHWPAWTWSNFAAATTDEKLHALVNSVVLSVAATVVATVPSILAAYAFSRNRIPFKRTILMWLLFLSGVPITILIVPVYEVFQAYDWLSLVPAAVFLGVTTIPFEVYIIKNAIDAIPLDLDEAARLERAGTARIIWRIILPLALPGIVAAAAYGFINAWGSFLIPLVLIADNNMQPSPISIFSFISADVIRYGQVAAYSLVYSLPVIMLYILVGKIFRTDYTLGGAVK